MRVLISNDDGVQAEGIRVLHKEMAKLGTAIIVAPEKERSTTGHSLTLHKPLRLLRFEKNVFAVSGGPADCIYVGINEVFKGKKPDLVISGINRGANLGQDVFYSGTVSAAREASNLGIPSVAVSLSLDHYKHGKPIYFQDAARALMKTLKKIMPLLSGAKSLSGALKTWPKGCLLNINIPNLPLNKIKGIRLGVQGYRNYGSQVLRRVDARGRDYFWIGGVFKGYVPNPDSDCWLVDHGYISVTPLELDTTMRDVFHSLEPHFGGKRGVLKL